MEPSGRSETGWDTPRDISIRDAQAGDSPVVVSLILEMAQEGGDRSPITAAHAAEVISSGAGGVLLAEENGRPVGMLSYSLRPNLYHAAPACLIELLFVRRGARGRGAGGALVKAILARAEALGCAEISVSVTPDNPGAVRFYRGHGLTEEAMFLEKHFPR